ncbi:pentapeptide repeat-containing protein [Nostocaceae cyanobacterium CENA369]|uniref:Pentapeptide repeat-containing protein n=1 Tax=Dendronalium phyllosphericum CENA369 TaxID=1725256 RepID=A0A8J7I7G4_9NOST|nr:pentapeptide repeat-containing protein [Dendronalium phyllosphericum]MBH8574581.1 pentapeptide repeat-containing protein [Dendronalium phyllosphericum CENA369]
MRILADADLVLEFFLNRSSFAEDAHKLLVEIAKLPEVEVYVTDKCLKRAHFEFLDRKSDRTEYMVNSIIDMLDGRIIKINNRIKEKALNSPLRDFDSAEEVACAMEMQLNTIVTQNPQNFDGSTLKIRSVGNLANIIQLEKNLEQSYSLYPASSGVFQLNQTPEANQSAAKLHEAGLHGTDLHGVDLHGVDLSGVNLYASNSYGANLCNADLSGANLCNADLSSANLSGANLSHADLRGADLSSADLTGVNLSDAIVEKALFGGNSGLSEDLELDLKQRGAVFEDC